MKDGNRLRGEVGFTLVELLVAMAVSLVVLYATLQLFENSQRTYIVQENVAEAQQNVRVGKLFVERDIRMAGAGIPEFSFGGTEVYPIEFENNVDGSSGKAATIPEIVPGTDLLVVRYKNFGVNPCGSDPGGTVDSCEDLPQLTLTADMPATATVAHVSQDLIAGNGWDADCYCDGTTYSQPSPGMPFIVSSPDGSQSAVLFQTSTLPNDDKIGNGPNFTYEGETYPNKLLNTFPSGSTLNFFHPDGLYQAIYYIENRNGIPCLVRDNGTGGGQVVAEYIEDMQFSFRLDTDDDGLVDSTINSTDLTDPQKRQVRMVTLNLVGRSAREYRNFQGGRPAIEDHAAGGADGYRRRRLAVRVKVRNLGL